MLRKFFNIRILEEENITVGGQVGCAVVSLRHCERSEAIPQGRQKPTGLLRCVRNDTGAFQAGFKLIHYRPVRRPPAQIEYV